MKRFEAASTHAWIDRPVLVVCPYNTELLPDAVIDAALETHERLAADAARAQRCAGPQLRAVRDRPSSRRGEARRAGLHDDDVELLVSAASELALNSFLHAQTTVHVSTWAVDGWLMCQIEDAGPGLWLVRSRSDRIELGRGRRASAVRLTFRVGTVSPTSFSSRL